MDKCSVFSQKNRTKKWEKSGENRGDSPTSSLKKIVLKDSLFYILKGGSTPVNCRFFAIVGRVFGSKKNNEKNGEDPQNFVRFLFGFLVFWGCVVCVVEKNRGRGAKKWRSTGAKKCCK